MLRIQKPAKDLKICTKMKQSQIHCVLLFLALALGLSTSSGVPHLRKHYVRFINQLDNKVLNVNCKNQNPYIDLNLHILLPQEEYEFSYMVNRTMLFNCDLRHGSTSAVFPVSDRTTKRQCGGNHCVWKAQEDGVYVLNRKTNVYKFMHGWGK